MSTVWSNTAAGSEMALVKHLGIPHLLAPGCEPGDWRSTKFMLWLMVKLEQPTACWTIKSSWRLANVNSVSLRCIILFTTRKAIFIYEIAWPLSVSLSRFFSVGVLDRYPVTKYKQIVSYKNSRKIMKTLKHPVHGLNLIKRSGRCRLEDTPHCIAPCITFRGCTPFASAAWRLPCIQDISRLKHLTRGEKHSHESSR